MDNADSDGAARMHEFRGSVQSFSRIPTVLTGQEILDKAFRRASRVSVPAKDRLARVRGTEQSRLRAAQNTIQATLEKIVQRFPSFDRLPPFYLDLVGLLVDLDRTRKALGAVDWAAKQVEAIGDESAARIKNTRREDEIFDAKKRAYGRISSVLKQIDKHLMYLNEVREAIRRLPTVDPTVPTIVVAGYPNVGKSSLIRKVSTAEPEVASYPFTTKGVAVGHFERRRHRYQIVDTPGLLDRDLNERNDIEKQAILALQHLADVVVFVLDPSEYCGYPMDAQLRLLEETRRVFPESPVLVAENKVDVKRPEATAGRFQISTETGEGVDDLIAAAVEAVGPASH